MTDYDALSSLRYKQLLEFVLLLLFLNPFILTGCKDTPPVSKPPETPVEPLKASEFTTVLAPLIDPAKLDTLKGKRAATPQLRKA
jgi:hypothetical protein